MTRRALVTGAGGFLGHHLARRLVAEGVSVRGVDLHEPLYEPSPADEFVIGDLRDPAVAERACAGVEDVYALAADMGGMGYLATHGARMIRDNTLIDVHTLDAAVAAGAEQVFYASSACVYPDPLQSEARVTPLREDDAYPAQPGDPYGWEKLHAEHLLAAHRDELGLRVRIARFHNVYGPLGTWQGGREKAPAALCRKVAEAVAAGEDSIEIWGDGGQTRSFCFVDDAVDGVLRLMASDHDRPLNIGSDRLVTIDNLAVIAMAAAGVELELVHVPGPQGVRGRNSDNALVTKVLGWEPSTSLEDGMARTYAWVESQLRAG